MKIIIADADRPSVQRLTDFLKNRGHQVTVAYDVLQAVTALMRAPSDLIFIDLVLPGGAGMDLLGRVKKSTKTNMVPVVLTSSRPDPAAVYKAERIGIEAYLQKPYDFEKVTTILARVSGETVDASGTPQPPSEFSRVEVLWAEVARSSRQSTPLTLVIADAKSPSPVSRTAEQLPGYMKGLLRPYDSVVLLESYRVLILLPGCSASDAPVQVQRLKRALADWFAVTPEEVAVGVSVLTGKERPDPQAFLQTAVDGLEHARQIISA